MIPKCGIYFGEDLFSQREDSYYKIDLTVEGHACQHDILYQVFGDYRDRLARNGLMGVIGREEIIAELTKKSKRFNGKKHKQSSKDKTRATLKRKLKEDQVYREWLLNHAKTVLGKSNHKRNPSAGTAIMSGPNKRQYMRQHWKKEVWGAVREKWENRTGYHWGKKTLAKTFGVSVKTIENMLELIQQGIDWDVATSWETKF
jgi:hypothetical protein